MLRQKSSKRLIFFSRLFFLIYIIFLVYILFFSESLGRTIKRETYSYNLSFFKEIKRYLDWSQGSEIGMQMMIYNIFGNILLYIPFGILYPLSKFKPKNPFLLAILVMVLSFLFEILQYFSKKGSFDIDDILLNTIGAIIGYIIFLLGIKIKNGRNKRK